MSIIALVFTSTQYSPVPEVLVGNPVGEALTTNTDAFKHTVAGQLMHHQGSVNDTWKEHFYRYFRNEIKKKRSFN